MSVLALIEKRRKAAKEIPNRAGNRLKPKAADEPKRT